MCILDGALERRWSPEVALGVVCPGRTLGDHEGFGMEGEGGLLSSQPWNGVKDFKICLLSSALSHLISLLLANSTPAFCSS